MAPQQTWRPETWDRSPAPFVVSQKWDETDKTRDAIYRESKDSRDWKDRDRDAREREKDKKKVNNSVVGNNKKKKEKEIKADEDQKKLDLDTRYVGFLRFKSILILVIFIIYFANYYFIVIRKCF